MLAIYTCVSKHLPKHLYEHIYDNVAILMRSSAALELLQLHCQREVFVKVFVIAFVKVFVKVFRKGVWKNDREKGIRMCLSGSLYIYIYIYIYKKSKNST